VEAEDVAVVKQGGAAVVFGQSRGGEAEVREVVGDGLETRGEVGDE